MHIWGLQRRQNINGKCTVLLESWIQFLRGLVRLWLIKWLQRHPQKYYSNHVLGWAITLTSWIQKLHSLTFWMFVGLLQTLDLPWEIINLKQSFFSISIQPSFVQKTLHKVHKMCNLTIKRQFYKYIPIINFLLFDWQLHHCLVI